MRRIVFPTILLLSACNSATKNAEEAVAYNLFDPDSAKFREVRRVGNSIVCGQVNAKNRMGAYSGFKDFYVVEIGGEWVPKIVDQSDEVVNRIRYRRFLKHCNNEAYRRLLESEDDAELAAQAMKKETEAEAQRIGAEIEAKYGFPKEEPVEIMEVTEQEPTDAQIRSHDEPNLQEVAH